MSGWILKHRKILNHWLHPSQQDRKFIEYEAWDDLLFKAVPEDKEILFSGNLIHLAIGECIISTNKLAERWKWTRIKTEKFLTILETEEMIKRSKIEEKNIKSNTRLKILNYRDLQLKNKHDCTRGENPEDNKHQSFKKTSKNDTRAKELTLEDIESKIKDTCATDNTTDCKC